MRSGFTNTEIGRLRTRPHLTRWYLAVHRPASLVTATLANAPVSYPVSAITISGYAGASEQTDDHQTIWIGSTAGGSNKGRIRLRKAMTTTSRLYVSEAGSGLVNWIAGDHITVMDEFAPWTKHPRFDTATSQWLSDYDETYTSQLQNYGPIISMGAPFVGFLVNGSVTGSYIGGSTAFLDGATYSNASWVFPGAVVTPSALGTEANPVIRTYTQPYPDGKYVTLKVVDSAGASNKSKRLAFTFTDRTQPHRVEFGQITGGLRTGGYETELRVLTNATSATFPDMAEVVIFEEASFGTVGSSIGGNVPFRSNIVFRGWILGDTVRVNPFHGDVSFRVRTIDGIMRQTYSYDSFLANASAFPSASNWIAASTLTIDRAAINLLKHRSTVGDLVDFTLASGIAMTDSIAFQDLPAGDWWTQLTLNYAEKGIAGYVSADMQSNLYASFDAQISGTSANIPVAMHIARGDRRDQVTIDQSQIDKLAEVQIYSVTGGTEDTASRIGALSPGDAKGYFGGLREHARGLFLSSQDLAATWAGNMRAKGNNSYPKTIVPLAGNYRLDSVPQCRVTMSLSATDNPREISWSNETFLPYETRLTYDSRAGIALGEIEMEKVVQGIGGSAITFPLVTVAPSDDPPTTPPPPAPDPPAQGTGFGTVYVVTPHTIARTRDFSSSSPDWTGIAPSGTSFLYDWILDPWHPTTTGYLTAASGIWKATNLNTTNPTWTRLLSKAEIETATGVSDFDTPAKIIGSINQENYVIAFYNVGNLQLWCSYSEDGGTTWSHQAVHTNIHTKWRGAADVVPYTIGNSLTIYALLHSDVGNDEAELWKSTNKGATWTQVLGDPPLGNLSAGGFECVSLSCPYENNSTGNIIYMSHWRGNVNHRTFKSTTSGTTAAEITIDGATSVTGTNVHRTGAEAYTQDSNRISVWKSVGGMNGELWTSTDGATTFTQKAATGLTTMHARASGGFPYNSAQYYVVTASEVAVSVDAGDTFAIKTGNLATSMLRNMERGQGVIVPVWTSE